MIIYYKKSNNNESKKNNFSLLYTCLNIIILSFFVFLTVNSRIAPEKKKIAIGSLIGSFGMFKLGLTPITIKNSRKIGLSLINIGKSKVTLETIKQIILKSRLESYVDIKTINGSLLFSFNGKIVFVRGTDILNKTFYTVLNRIYNVLSRAETLKIKIKAFPDKIYNNQFISPWDLAAHRAFRIAKFFMDRGIKKNNITAFGEGKIQPNGKTLELTFTGKIYEKKEYIKKQIKIKDFNFGVY